MAKILIADDEESIRTILKRALRSHGYETQSVSDGAQAELALQQGNFDIAILDIRMPGLSGLELLDKQRKFPSSPSIFIVTAQDTMENAVEAMKRGAYDYITKPFDLDEVVLLVGRALETRHLRQEIKELKRSKVPAIELIGKSKPMQEIFKTIGRVANQDLTVLLQGESGTGKELVAKAIHYQGIRAPNPFVAVNCSAIPETLLESELFGFKKGTFTGAIEDKPGYFEQAQGGTLFLDEIGEMSVSLQSKLLRVLQEKEVQRLGDSKTLPIDVRVVAATNQDLGARVKQGKFREDLYFRLNVMPIHMPALRERREDVPHLVAYFMNRIAMELGAQSKTITPEAMDYLKGRAWPGNVRELENLLKRVFVLSQGNRCDLTHFKSLAITPGTVPWEVNNLQGLEKSIENSLEQQIHALSSRELSNLYDKFIPLIERPLIRLCLKMQAGNQIKAAMVLGINRNTLRKRIRELQIDRRGLFKKNEPIKD